MARPIVLIPHLFRLAYVINFRKDYSPPSSLPSRPTTRLVATIVTTQERLRTDVSLNGHNFRGSKCNGGNYTLDVFYLMKRDDELFSELTKLQRIVKVRVKC